MYFAYWYLIGLALVLWFEFDNPETGPIRKTMEEAKEGRIGIFIGIVLLNALFGPILFLGIRTTEDEDDFE